MKKHLFLGVLMLVLTACQTAPAQMSQTTMTFSHLAPISLDVAQIEVYDEFESVYKAPFVDFQFPIPPLKAVHQWVNDRMQPNGRSNLLRVTIVDASVKEVRLPKRSGFMDWFYVEPSERYEGHLLVKMDVLGGGRALSESSITIEVARNQSALESASLADREALYIQLTQDLMQLFNLEAERQINAHFSRYLMN